MFKLDWHQFSIVQFPRHQFGYGSERSLLIHQFFMHNKDIFCYFGSFLVYSGLFQLTSLYIYDILLVDLVVIKHGCHSFILVSAASRWMFFIHFFSLPPTLFEVSSITSIEYLLISYHFKR